MKVCLLILVIGHTVAAEVESGNWTSFRNGGSSQVAGNYPRAWSPNAGVSWQRELPGYGQSVPVTWKGRVVVTTVEGDQKETCTVVCLNLNTGDEIWKVSRPSSLRAASNYRVSRAAPTPTVDRNGVYAFFESGDLLCVDHDGNVKWSRSLSKEYGAFENHHGLGSSPAEHQNLIFLNIEHRGDSYLLAVKKDSGKSAWKVPRPSGMSWTSPVVLTSADPPQLLVSSGGSVTSYHPQSGKKLWELGDLGGNSVPSPTVDGKLVFVGARVPEFGSPAQAAKSNLCLKVADGDGEPFQVMWRAKDAVSDYASPVVCKGCVYLLNKVGVLHCLDSVTGKPHYKKRLPVRCWATPIVSGGRIFFFGKDGKALVLNGGPEYAEPQVNHLWEPDNPPLPESYREAVSERKPGAGRPGLTAMLLRGDKNRDGKLTPEELPDSMKEQFARLDRNKDGVLNDAELKQMEKSFAERRRDSRNESRDPIVYGVAAAQDRFLIRTGTRLFCVGGMPSP